MFHLKIGPEHSFQNLWGICERLYLKMPLAKNHKLEACPLFMMNREMDGIKPLPASLHNIFQNKGKSGSRFLSSDLFSRFRVCLNPKTHTYKTDVSS